ncbi:MAG: GRP family sugar transporter [Streptococcaceae bacterium]|jgi:glucose uptake protein|nr:GRP family sugar transporter [Streptococcaceae bacterium]
MLGIIYSLVPMVMWGSVGFAANKLGGSAKQQTMGMTIGAFFFALVVFILMRPPMSSVIFIFGFCGGLLWAIGQFAQFNSMKYLGVSVASPLSGGSQLVLGSVLGVLAFHEWTKSLQFFLGTVAIVLLLIAFYFSAKRDPNSPHVMENLSIPKGFKWLTISTLGYVAYVVLYNNFWSIWFASKPDTLSLILPMSLGMMTGALVLAKGAVKFGKFVIKNTLVGVMWGVGNIFMLIAANLAGIAIALTFSQLGALISTVLGIAFLGEKKTSREKVYISIGGVLFVVGAVILGVVKANG